MRKLPSEYILKGIFLGLILYLALEQGINPPASYLDTLLPVNLAMLGGLLSIGIGLAGLLKLREGYQVRGRVLAFVLFLFLECPTLVYTGIIAGGVVGAYLIRRTETTYLLGYTLGGGAFVGVLFALLRQVQKSWVRLWLIGLLGAGAVGAVLFWFMKLNGGEVITDPRLFAIQLLIGIPYFYLLTFAGQEEESEIEIGAMCAFLAVGGSILTYNILPARGVGLMVPFVLYFWYTFRVLPGLRVLKHAFRGMSYARIGRHRRALLAFRRALQLDPTNALARDGFWQVHCELDLAKLAEDRETLALLDFDLCLERAGSLLIQGRPTPHQADEAMRLLELVVSQKPQMQPSIDYWLAVSATHNQAYEEAATRLKQIIEPEHYGQDNPERLKVLLPAWQLGLVLHPKLRALVGEPQLAIPGRRMDALAAAERHLVENPDDPGSWDLKRLLYRDLTEAEVEAARNSKGEPPLCDYVYLREQGLSLIEDKDQWQRGGEYLRMAVIGLPASGPTLFVKIAQANERAGQDDEALAYFQRARDAGRAVGVKNLEPATAKTYFATVKYLGELALSRGDLDAAIENYRLYSESPSSGLETLRTLADLCERKGDVLAALRYVERALIYTSKDPDLTERRKRYYVSISPEDLRARLENYRDCFDVDFCLNWAKTILDAPYSNEMEWLETVQQLVELSLVVRPASLKGQLMLARAYLRLGRRDESLAILEALRNNKPESFASGDDEDAWYVGSQLLGDLYMEQDRPELAIPCYQDFRKSHRSGARTLLRLGQAYEQTGEVKKAVSFYTQVTAYEGNPLTSEAYDALHRLGA